MAAKITLASMPKSTLKSVRKSRFFNRHDSGTRYNTRNPCIGDQWGVPKGAKLAPSAGGPTAHTSFASGELNDGSRNRKRAPAPIAELDVLWVTAGLGCDGETIAMTAATQPSIEDIVCGLLPWVPKIHFHNPFLAIENGEEFLKPFHAAAKGQLGPFILVVEGSIPNENNKQEGYWASWGTDGKRSNLYSLANGLTVWRPTPGRWLRWEPARPTAEFTLWKAIQLVAWGFPITWDGSGSRRQTYPSSACQDVQPSPTI